MLASTTQGKQLFSFSSLVFRVIKAVIVHIRVSSNLNKKENLILDLIYFCSSNI